MCITVGFTELNSDTMEPRIDRVQMRRLNYPIAGPRQPQGQQERCPGKKASA